MKTYDIDDIQKKLARTFPQPTAERNIIVKPMHDNTGRMMCVFFALPGTPPKSYGIAAKVTKGYELSLYDAHGKRFKAGELCWIDGITEAAKRQREATKEI